MLARRNHHLQAMGIQVWQSREDQPDAEAESQLDGCVDANIDLTPASAGTETAAMSSPLPSNDAPVTGHVDSSVSDAEDSVTVAQAANPEFRIASIVFPGVCVVVVDVPTDTINPVTAQHVLFLKALLLSMGLQVSEEPEVTLFNWPMLRGTDFDQSETAARDASQAFLRGQQVKNAVRFVLLMGDLVGQYLFADDCAYTDEQGRLLGEQPQVRTHSMEKIFVEPLLKARVWQDLQPLIFWLQQSQ